MRAKVTTSWDDGHSGDVRVAEVLAAKGMGGTFYWTVDHAEFTYPGKAETADLLEMGMEIGAHTMTHADLTTLDDERLRWELEESKSVLEDYVQRPMRTFCYPFGHFDKRVREAVATAGYELARTTEAFRTAAASDLLLTPVTMQVYGHSAKTHLAHSLRRGNLSGLTTWLMRHRGTTDLESIASQSLARIRAKGGVLHIWGHSWELERFELWDTLGRLLDTVSGHDDVEYLTNGQLIPGASTSNSV